MSDNTWETERPPRVRGTRWQQKLLAEALGRMMLPPAVRAVLDVIVRHANGAGYAYPSIATIQAESGYSHAQVHRALTWACAGDPPLLKRYRFKSTRENTPTARRAETRRGQGANNYRLGPALRAAARLYEIEPEQRETPSREQRETPRIERPSDGVNETPRGETPQTGESPCSPGGLMASGAPLHETPERLNGKYKALRDGLVPRKVEVHVAPAREALDRARRVWERQVFVIEPVSQELEESRRRTRELAGALPADEQAILVDLMELLDAVLVDDPAGASSSRETALTSPPGPPS